MNKARPARKRVTLASVAEHAEVSVATASLILGNRDGWIEQFHPDTVKRVQASAEQLGYRRNLFASGLPCGDSRFFALVLREPEPEGSGLSRWNFQGALLEGIAAAAQRHGLYSVLAGMPGAEDSAAHLSAIVDGGVFGSVFESPNPRAADIARAQLERGRPSVVLFPESTAAWPTNAIDVDNRAVGRIAGHLLAAAGPRRWTIVRYERMTEAQRLRCEGLILAAREAGAAVTTISLPMELGEAGAAMLLASHLKNRTSDGVYAVDSTTSMAAMLGCVRAGLTPNRDLALVGCDASHWTIPGLPRITSVDVCWQEAGAAAVEHLVQARESRARFRSVLLRPRIVEADTCPVRPRRRRVTTTAGKIAC